MEQGGSWLLLHSQPLAAEALTLAAKFFDRSVDDPGLLLVTDEGSLKIEHVRTLQAELGTAAPGGKGKLVVITPGERITLPAQQALLKLLEEPPQGTTMVILAQSSSAVLPTIQSRCRIASLEQHETDETNGFLWKLSQAKTLKEAVEIGQGFPTKREEAVAFLTSELHQRSAKPTDARLIKLTKKAIEVLESLRGNVSPALCGDELCTFLFR